MIPLPLELESSFELLLPVSCCGSLSSPDRQEVDIEVLSDLLPVHTDVVLVEAAEEFSEADRGLSNWEGPPMSSRLSRVLSSAMSLALSPLLAIANDTFDHRSSSGSRMLRKSECSCSANLTCLLVPGPCLALRF